MSDITQGFIIDYLHAIQKEDSQYIEAIKKYAKQNHIPIIKDEVKQLLELLCIISKPKHILEIGTAIGYSSIILSKYLEEGGSITTIERSSQMVLQAKKNIKKAKKEKVITVLEGDAEIILPNLNKSFDLIFMDAAKGQYITFLPFCFKLLKDEGILVSDNVLQEGYIAKSRWSIPRRQRTIHQRMRKYLWEISHNPILKTVILPVADGLTISYKQKENR